MVSPNIKIYGTNWCPDTVRTKQYLTERGISFTWCDIEQDKQGCKFVEGVNGGKRRVPTIVFPDGSMLVEPSNSELGKKLGIIKQ